MIGPTSDTWANRPTSPWTGQLFYATDLACLLRYDGSAWRVVSSKHYTISYASTLPLSTTYQSLSTSTDIFVVQNAIVRVDYSLEIQSDTVSTEARLKVRLYDNDASSPSTLLEADEQVAKIGSNKLGRISGFFLWTAPTLIAVNGETLDTEFQVALYNSHTESITLGPNSYVDMWIVGGALTT